MSAHRVAPQPPARPTEKVAKEKNGPSIPMLSPQTLNEPYWPMHGNRKEQVNGGETNMAKNRPRKYSEQMGDKLFGNGTSHQLHSQRETSCQTLHPPFVPQTRESVRTLPKPQQFWTPDQATGTPEIAHGVNNVTPPMEQGPEDFNNLNDDGLLEEAKHTNHWNPAGRETSLPCETPSSSLAQELLAKALQSELG